MTNIRRIVRSILRDVIQAQHDANLYSLQLSEEYASQGASANFKMPAAQIGELDIEVKYAIASTKPEDTVRTEVNAREEKKFIGKLSGKLSGLVLSRISAEVKRSKVPYQENGFGYVDDLPNHPLMNRFVSEAIAKALSENSALMYSDGSFECDYIAKKVLEVAERRVLGHGDIRELFALPGGDVLKKMIVDKLDDNIVENVRKITNEVSMESYFRKRTAKHSIPVIVDAEALAKMPAESIQTLRLKVGPQELKNDQ